MAAHDFNFLLATDSYKVSESVPYFAFLRTMFWARNDGVVLLIETLQMDSNETLF